MDMTTGSPHMPSAQELPASFGDTAGHEAGGGDTKMFGVCDPESSTIGEVKLPPVKVTV
jgi:hypothetical protein